MTQVQFLVLVRAGVRKGMASAVPFSFLNVVETAAVCRTVFLRLNAQIRCDGICHDSGSNTRKMTPNGVSNEGQTAVQSWPMASTPQTSIRLSPIIQAYLDDLAKLGAYGRGRAGVMRRFIENGIKDAIEKKVIAPRDVSEFGEIDESDDED
jgi:predicted DNA-binding protein